jgi:hypothetical protein
MTEQHRPEVHITKASKRSPKAAKPKAQPHPCECGCEGQTVTGKARFIPGHDAKLKSRLINEALDPNASRALRTDAERRLAKLGWTKFLDASRAARTKKTEAKATKPAKKAEQAA